MLLTRAPVVLLPLDLHVLSMPPAFVLSQDQTLRCRSVCLSFLFVALALRLRRLLSRSRICSHRCFDGGSVLHVDDRTEVLSSPSATLPLFSPTAWLCLASRRNTAYNRLSGPPKNLHPWGSFASRCQRTPKKTGRNPWAQPCPLRTSCLQGRQKYGLFATSPNGGTGNVPKRHRRQPSTKVSNTIAPRSAL